MITREEKPTKEEFQFLQQDLEDLEWYIREFSAFLPIAVCNVNPLGIIIDINQGFERLSGYKLIEVVGEPLNKFFFEKDEIEATEKIIQRQRETREKSLNLVTKEKKKIPVSVWISRREDSEGNYIGYFAGIIDITKFKELEQTLEEKVRQRTAELEERNKEFLRSQEALANILEDMKEARDLATEERDKTLAIITNFADGLLVFDKTNRLSLINPQAERFFEVKSENVVGQPILELTKIQKLESLMSLLGREIRGVFRKELQIQENLILEASTIPVMRGEEKLGTLVILHDISREKMIERMKTEFVSLAAHQLRTPVSAIKWTLRMLLDGDLGEITQEQKNFIEKTYKSNERMITLINDLLDVTRIEEGRYLYKPVLADIENVVHFVINSYKEEVAKRGLKLKFKKPEKKFPPLKIDVEKTRLAIQNLLDNAVRYTKPGGSVTISLKHVKNEIEFSVKDTGVGIPKDQQERVFSKFFRGANVIRMETEGSGLGLYITKNIIEAHGGKIWFESKENVGTTFYFTIPVKEEFGEFLKEF